MWKFLPVLVLFTVGLLAADQEEGYVHRGSRPITVQVWMAAVDMKDYTREIPPVSLTALMVKPGDRFSTIASFIPLSQQEYGKLVKKYAEQGVRLPEYRWGMVARIYRGSPLQLVKQYNRSVRYSGDFQLQDGDVIKLGDAWD